MQLIEVLEAGERDYGRLPRCWAGMNATAGQQRLVATQRRCTDFCFSLFHPFKLKPSLYICKIRMQLVGPYHQHVLRRVGSVCDQLAQVPGNDRAVEGREHCRDSHMSGFSHTLEHVSENEILTDSTKPFCGRATTSTRDIRLRLFLSRLLVFFPALSLEPHLDLLHGVRAASREIERVDLHEDFLNLRCGWRLGHLLVEVCITGRCPDQS